MLARDAAFVLDAFAEPVSIARAERRVVWGDPFAEVPTGDSSIASRDSGFWTTSEVAAELSVGDPVRRAGVSYRIVHFEPDSDGLVVRVVLERNA